MKLKTLAIFGAITLVAQGAFAQTLPSDTSRLPQLRTSAPIRSQIDRDMAPSLRAKSSSKDDDVAKVVPVKCKKPTGKFPWNFDKVKVTDIVDQISRLTCRNFIISSDVKGSKDMTIMSRTPVDVDQAWQAFLSALESNQLALEEIGSYYKIIPRTDASKQNIPVYEKGESLPNNEGMITLLYDVRNISKDVASTLVNGLIGSKNGGTVTSVGDTFLIISDSSSNVRRILKILEKVDIAGAANRLNIVTLVHAQAKDIKAKLDEIFDKSGSSSRNSILSAAARADRIRSGIGDLGGGGESSSLQKIIADDRTNKLIIIASDKTYDRIKEIIDLLDVAATDASSQGQINVYFLKNGDSKKMAATLTTLVSGTQSSRTNSPRISNFGPEPEGTSFQGEIKVTADEATNSLVIVASPRDYRAVVKVIEKLDKERVQVYVEAIIMDVSITDTNAFGLGLYAGVKTPIPGSSQGGLGIFGNPSGQKLASSVASALTTTGLTSGLGAAAAIPSFLGNAIGIMGLAPIPLPGGSSISIPSLGLALNALQTSADTDILSTPSLMTLDNEKATITVGESIPYASGLSTVGSANGVGGFPLTQISRLDVKLKFEITPSVNDENNVKLVIDQDITELGLQEQIANSGPQYRTNTKSAKTVVMAKDQQTIAIGGLINNKVTNSGNKLPWLGDIPIIGWLFKDNSKTTDKRNLMLVLTPYVIRSESDLHKIYERKMKEREAFAKLYFGDKISKYDPYIDYSKKSGPLDHLVRAVDTQMQKVENGGPGLPGETVIRSEVPEKKEVKTDTTVPEIVPDSPADQPFPLDRNDPIFENIPPPPQEIAPAPPLEPQPSPQGG